MVRKDSKHIVFKPTFHAVENTQQQLRKHLEELISQNRPLKNEEEKTLFYKELSHSTLGLGTFKKFRIYIDRVYEFGNIESTGRWLASQTENKISIPGDMGNIDSPTVDINVFWKKLLDNLYYVFPVALEKAISMSRESEALPGQKDSFFVGVDDK